MKFSYLQMIKEEMDLLMFQRGQCLFIDGKVVEKTELKLPNWRQYQVLDRKQIYFIKVPVIHLLLNDDNLNWQTLVEVASCDCDYFANQLSCPHLVAVCASLDQEFHLGDNFKKNNPIKKTIGTSDFKDSGTIFSQILQSETKKTEVLWIENWQFYLNNSINWQHQLWPKKAKFLQAVASNQDLGRQFLEKISSELPKICQDFHREKLLIQLAAETVLASGPFWYSFWQKQFQLDYCWGRLDFWIYLYLWRQQTQISQLWPQIKSDLQKLGTGDQQKLFQKISQNWFDLDPKNLFKLELELALTLKYQPWLAANLVNLEPSLLVTTLKMIVEQKIITSDKLRIEVDQVERLLQQKILVWSNFLQSSDNYQELVETLKSWQTANWSEVWQETIELIALEHAKKPKLITALQSLSTEIIKLRKTKPKTNRIFVK